MVEHLNQRQFEDYRRRQLSAAELLSVSDHLGDCEACRRHIEGAMNGDAAFFALKSEIFGEAAEISSPHSGRVHLTPEQMARYVDGNPSGEELQTVGDHLTICDPCALAVDDLHVFRDHVAPSLGREYHPAPVASPVEGWWRRTIDSRTIDSRTIDWLRGLFRRFPRPAFAPVLAVLVSALIGWLMWRTPGERRPQQEIVVSPTSQSQREEIVVSLTPPSDQGPGPVPSPPTPAPVIARLNDGEGQLTLDREGNLAGADDLPPAYRSMLKAALTTRRIERSSQLKGLARPPSPLMSADKQRSEFSVIEPVGSVLVTDRPAFRWSPLEGASRYVVEVFDREFNQVAASPQLTGHSWAAPQSLPRGETYAWQVKAIKDGQEVAAPRPPAPQARFRILDRGKANELAKAKRTYPSSHLTLGLLYAEAGLLKEAERELRRLRKANPDAEIARRLLGQIQALRRRSE